MAGFGGYMSKGEKAYMPHELQHYMLLGYKTSLDGISHIHSNKNKSALVRMP